MVGALQEQASAFTAAAALAAGAAGPGDARAAAGDAARQAAALADRLGPVVGGVVSSVLQRHLRRLASSPALREYAPFLQQLGIDVSSLVGPGGGGEGGGGPAEVQAAAGEAADGATAPGGQPLNGGEEPALAEQQEQAAPTAEAPDSAAQPAPAAAATQPAPSATEQGRASAAEGRPAPTAVAAPAPEPAPPAPPAPEAATPELVVAAASTAAAAPAAPAPTSSGPGRGLGRGPALPARPARRRPTAATPLTGGATTRGSQPTVPAPAAEVASSGGDGGIEEVRPRPPAPAHAPAPPQLQDMLGSLSGLLGAGTPSVSGSGGAVALRGGGAAGPLAAPGLAGDGDGGSGLGGLLGGLLNNPRLMEMAQSPAMQQMAEQMLSGNGGGLTGEAHLPRPEIHCLREHLRPLLIDYSSATHPSEPSPRHDERHDANDGRAAGWKRRPAGQPRQPRRPWHCARDPAGSGRDIDGWTAT